uniref:Uncharacterized protein n=1 Tax=Lotharella globosa TaxID=91324 RepID=A0A7S3YU91_9EUKA
MSSKFFVEPNRLESSHESFKTTNSNASLSRPSCPSCPSPNVPYSRLEQLVSPPRHSWSMMSTAVDKSPLDRDCPRALVMHTGSRIAVDDFDDDDDDDPLPGSSRKWRERK